MKIGEKLYGFLVTEERYVEELSATVYTLIYESCGARLTYIAREDENKTFSITFKTLPEDSTGVFHILEHSVLCGSEKYPVKDPFVELLKGSLNTFLNAMTFQDKTMYPVSSRCDKDFSNLVDVYMDAVLNPLVIKNKLAFLQEGWHYEILEDGSLGYNGVVLNEMRGDYSTPESVATRHINDMLYSGTPYAHDSGGDPDEITDLAYEDFVRAHEKYYHPTYAELFLDGSVDLDSVLPIISAHLGRYTFSTDSKESFTIPRATISEPKERTVYYEVKEGEDPKNKARASISYIAADYSEGVKIAALGAIGKSLLLTNESPVKRALIESGLCEDVAFGISDGILEPSVNIDFFGIKDGCAEELIALFYSEMRGAAEGGIDRDELVANINLAEFIARERDFGSTPAGVANAMISLETLLYSDDPVGNFRSNDTFKALRERLEGDYFESLIYDVIVNNPRRATVILLPSTTLAKEREAEAAAELARIKASLSDEELQRIADECEALALWQEREDTEEAIATVPTLTLDDIPKEPTYTPSDISFVSGVEVIAHPIATNGIIYSTLYFDISDVPADELVYVDLFLKLVTNLPTTKHTAIELQRFLKAHIGSFDVGITPIADKSGGRTTIYFSAGVSVLRGEAHHVAPIIKEVLTETVFDDKKAIKNIIRQYVLAAEEGFGGAGHRIALGRVSASGCVASAVKEYTDGYEGYISYKRLDEEFDERFPRIREALLAVSKRLLDRSRTKIGITSDEDEREFLDSLVAITEERDSVVPVCNIKPFPVRREGIAIPARVGFASRGYNLFPLGGAPTGDLDVVRLLVGYERLWPEVRVKGGAYGAGMGAGITGTVGFYSYRDPNPVRSLDVFASVPDFLLEAAKGGIDLTRFIIGAIGDASPIRTPRMRGNGATLRYLRGLSHDDDREFRRQILSISGEDLVRAAELIRSAIECGGVCVVGPREKLLEIKDLDAILEI